MLNSRLFSHLFSLSTINIIIGWGAEFYVVKIFFFILIGSLSLLTILHKRNFTSPSLFFLMFISILLSFMYHHVSFEMSFNQGLIAFVKNHLLPVIFGMLIYNAISFVRINIFVLYLKIFVFLSIIFIFMQYFGFWYINLLFFSNEMIIPGYNTYTGISSSPFFMGSQLAIITPIILYYANPVTNYKHLFFMIFSFFSGQRGYFLTLFINYFKKQLSIKIILILFPILFSISVFIMMIDSNYIFRGYDIDRIALYLSGIYYIVENPMGAGTILMDDDILYNIMSNSEFLSNYENAVMVTRAPHNFLINAMIVHGVLFAIPVIYFLYKVYKINNIFSWAFLLGVFISLFHNLSFLYIDFFSWIILSFAFKYKRRFRNYKK